MNRRLKVGIVCYPTFGGSGVVATEVGLALAARGHRVHVLSYEVPSRLDHFVENVSFHEVAMPQLPAARHSPYTLALASKIVEVSRYEGLDILHVHYAVPHATSAYLARQILGPEAPPHRDHPARHRHHAGGQRPQLPAHHPLLHHRRATG